MSNKTIAAIFLGVSLFLLIGAVLIDSALLSIYGIINVGLAYCVYHGVDKKPPSGRMRL